MNTHSELIESARETLRQGETLLLTIDNETYTRRHRQVFNASMGGHYRHCLDHFRSLLNAAEAGELNYDHRERETAVETDRLAALRATQELLDGFAQLNPDVVTWPLRVTCKTSYAVSGSQESPSTVGREIMYAVAHAVHHYALMGVMGALMELPLPAGFGVAPSTLRHQAETKNALAA